MTPTTYAVLVLLFLSCTFQTSRPADSQLRQKIRVAESNLRSRRNAGESHGHVNGYLHQINGGRATNLQHYHVPQERYQRHAVRKESENSNREVRDRVRRSILTQSSPSSQQSENIQQEKSKENWKTNSNIIRKETSSPKPATTMNQRSQNQQPQKSNSNTIPTRKESPNQNPIPGSPSTPQTNQSSVYVLSGVSKYAVLHLVPPVGIQVNEIKNSLDEQQQRYIYTAKRSGEISYEKTGLAIVLIEFDISDGEDVTYETILETEE